LGFPGSRGEGGTKGSEGNKEGRKRTTNYTENTEKEVSLEFAMRRNPIVLIILLLMGFLSACTTPQPGTDAAGAHSKNPVDQRTQATVVLRITVKGDGTSPKVEVEKSSGYPVLDNAAIAAVKKWTDWPAGAGRIYTQSFTFSIQ